MRDVEVLDASATRARLPYPALIEAVAEAMRGRRAGRVHSLERSVLPLPGDASYLVMPAADRQLAVTKLVTVHPRHRGSALPTIQGLVCVTDAIDGRPLMLLDGPTVTARRTAAVTLLGLRTLARAPPGEVLLVGTGAQAREHALALAECAAPCKLHVVGTSAARAQALCTELASVGVQAAPHERIDGALRLAHCVITLTTSERPVLPAQLDDATLVVGVGAFRPHMVELPPALLQRRRIVVDALDGARSEAGDLLQAGIDWARVSELVDHLDRPPCADPTVFKTVGHAAWDLAAAHVASASR